MFRRSEVNLCYCAGAVATINAAFGSGSGPVILHDVMCNGLESTLWNCTSDRARRISICSHTRDAGVICTPGKMLVMRVESENGGMEYKFSAIKCLVLCAYIFVYNLSVMAAK